MDDVGRYPGTRSEDVCPPSIPSKYREMARKIHQGATVTINALEWYELKPFLRSADYVMSIDGDIVSVRMGA